MKQFKLIKKYPFINSPEVGYILDRGTSDYWLLGNRIDPESLPEYWEPLNTPEYEILVLKYLGDLFYKSDEPLPSFFGKGVKYKIPNSESFIPLSSISNSEITIHSVKRLIDGQVFTVGDKVNPLDGEGTSYLIDDKLKVEACETSLWVQADYKISELLIIDDQMVVKFNNVAADEGFETSGGQLLSEIQPIKWEDETSKLTNREIINAFHHWHSKKHLISFKTALKEFQK